MILNAHDLELVRAATADHHGYQDIGKTMTRFIVMMSRRARRDSCGLGLPWPERLAWRAMAVRLQVVGLNHLSQVARAIHLA